jgi:hypothetical protein
MQTIWHYTSMEHAKSILKDKMLRISSIEKKWGWKPALWFSRATRWEPTATKMFRFKETNELRLLTEEEQLELIGMARFGIEFTEQLISWNEYKNNSGIPAREHRAMAKVGKEKGAHPNNWYCSFEDIPLNKCVAIEQFDGKEWISIMNIAL